MTCITNNKQITSKLTPVFFLSKFFNRDMKFLCGFVGIHAVKLQKVFFTYSSF